MGASREKYRGFGSRVGMVSSGDWFTVVFHQDGHELKCMIWEHIEDKKIEGDGRSNLGE